MTVIAVCKNRTGKLMMAGDRRDSTGWHYAQVMEVPKINKKNGLLIGATGSSDLCSLFVDDDAFEVPERKVKSVNKYMHHIFKQEVVSFLVKQLYGRKDKETVTPTLLIPPNKSCEVVIGIDGETWILTIDNALPEAVDSLLGHLALFRVSSPYSTGCGGQGTPDGIFKYLLRTKGYITEKDLRTTLEIVAEISPGCNDTIDVIKED